MFLAFFWIFFGFLGIFPPNFTQIPRVWGCLGRFTAESYPIPSNLGVFYGFCVGCFSPILPGSCPFLPDLGPFLPGFCPFFFFFLGFGGFFPLNSQILLFLAGLGCFQPNPSPFCPPFFPNPSPYSLFFLYFFTPRGSCGSFTTQ